MNKKNILGIDIGSITISAACLDEQKNINNTFYLFHGGRIREALVEILSDIDIKSIGAIAVTNSSPSIIKGGIQYDSRVSSITAVREIHNCPGSILSVGGEKFGLVLFDANGNYLNSRSNTSCAAGTGSFLDQQSKRLNLTGIEEFSRIAQENSGSIPKIASRCAVFAKTDIIHAQQEGYSLAEICDGLCYGLAKNIVDTLFGGKEFSRPVIFTGGVSKNAAVARHISSMIGCDLIIDKNSHIMGAIGAALCLINDGMAAEAGKYSSIDDIILNPKKEKNFFYPALELKYSSYPDFNSLEKYEYKSKFQSGTTPVEVDIYEHLDEGSVDCFIGIDIGSTSTKAVLVDRNSRVLAGLYTRTSGRPLEAVKDIFEAIDEIAVSKNIKLNISGSATTGSGRKFIGNIIGADMMIDEITAHARAAVEIDSEVDTIIEIGGQDSKFTTLKNGQVTLSIMNNVCAAGTGSFVEEQAKKLSCPLHDYSARTEGLAAPLSSDRCTVFMERDLNHYLAEGYSTDEILASVLHSIRENYLTKVAVEKSIGKKVFFQGATAKNRALVAAFEQKLGIPIIVSKFCHLTGAIGSALSLLDKNVSTKTFIGIDLYKKSIPITNEVCELCANHCKLKIAEIDGNISAFGFLCGRDYETKKHINKNISGFDMMRERRKIFGFKSEGSFQNDIMIGLPAGLHMLEDIPFWKKFFSLLGFKTISSEGMSEPVKEGKNLAGAEFCAPVSAFHGHVSYLTDKCDYIFLPVYLETKQKEKGTFRKFCYYTQFSSPLILSNTKLNKSENILSPLVQFAGNVLFSKFEIYKSLKKIAGDKISFWEISSAYDDALEFTNSSSNKLREIFKKETEAGTDVSVVLLGRPYTVLPSSMNKGIPEIFGRLGIKAFFQDMISSDKDDNTAIQPMLEAFHWKYAASIISAAEAVSKSEGVYPVLVTSFKCAPDSFVVEYAKRIFESHNKPYLVLQLDEHDSSVGYETRIEAAVRSFRNHHIAKKPEDFIRSAINFPDVSYKTETFRGKTLLIPGWDPVTCRLIEAILRHEGLDARILEEDTVSIQKSMKFNTGQCIPLNAIAQNTVDYIDKYKLDPSKTVLWNIESTISCNIRMYPYYIKSLFSSYGKKYEQIEAFIGEISFANISIKTAINSYFAFMIGGMLKKIGCRVRPYEIKKGITDQTINIAGQILYDMFLYDRSMEDALEYIVSMFERIETRQTYRPKVAIFGDLYSRDNDIMNQNLISVIEENGGEAITTPYSDYMKLIADPYIKRWFFEGKLTYAARMSFLNQAVKILDKKYYKIFNRILKEEEGHAVPSEEIFSNFNLKVGHTGESLDNLLKIFSLIKLYPDLELFVQTNPAFCCPSLVTEAMSEKIERLTGIPVLTITYDGTGGRKNDDVIPYLKYPRKRKPEQDEISGR